MNIGDCPYDDCEGVLMLEVPDRTPAYVKTECDACNRELWYRLSRVDPQAWTPEQFLAEHEVDEVNRRITARTPQQ